MGERAGPIELDSDEKQVKEQNVLVEDDKQARKEQECQQQ